MRKLMFWALILTAYVLLALGVVSAAASSDDIFASVLLFASIMLMTTAIVASGRLNQSRYQELYDQMNS